MVSRTTELGLGFANARPCALRTKTRVVWSLVGITLPTGRGSVILIAQDGPYLRCRLRLAFALWTLRRGVASLKRLTGSGFAICGSVIRGSAGGCAGGPSGFLGPVFPVNTGVLAFFESVDRAGGLANVEFVPTSGWQVGERPGAHGWDKVVRGLELLRELRA